MGGGDLNAKKAWHPNTLKNQERVWKAEQAAAEEKKRIQELERERAQERDRAELKQLAQQNLGSGKGDNDGRLHWMYDKPDKKVQDEDYLLGKAIDKNHDQAGKSVPDEIPAVARRIVGSSMLATAGDTQVDLARKIREDPLLLVKERERAARAALLNNPLHRRRLAELLRKEQEQRKEDKGKKKTKKKDKDLDSMLAAKFSALKGEQNLDIAKLLASDDSSSDSSSDEKKAKKKKKEKKKKKKPKEHVKKESGSGTESPLKSKKPKGCSTDTKNHERKSGSEDEGSSIVQHKKRRYITSEKIRPEKEQRRRNRESSSQDRWEVSRKRYYHERNIKPENRGAEIGQNRSNTRSQDRWGDSRKKDYHERDMSPEKRRSDKEQRRYNRESSSQDRYGESQKRQRNKLQNEEKEEQRSKKPVKLSKADMAARLQEMAAAGAEREIQRGRRVAAQREEISASEKNNHGSRVTSRNEARALPDSLESRIHSNRHYIQRDRRHMNEHFARR